ncbi:MAG: Si-specific NAD(P)(+) transhydrogenase [Pseudomonadota bacterium]
MKFDLIVIGSGPGGEAAALTAARRGLRVALVEERDRLGGHCAHVGTIPSKALRHYVRQRVRFDRNSLFRGQWREPPAVNWPKLVAKAGEVIEAQATGKADLLLRERVALFNGRASLSGPNTVRAVGSDGVVEELQARHIVLATGSRPYRPADIDFSHPRIYDSDTILGMRHTPQHVVIYGAGVIGCEYASIFCALGIQVDLVNSRPQLLDFLDAEISDALSYHLREQGVTIRHGEEYARVTGTADGVALELKSGKRIKADALLWSNGRTGNAQGLGLEGLGIQPSGRGHVAVDLRYRTALPHLYAVGDLIGPPSLASAAYDQGRRAAADLLGETAGFVDNVPTGIYTIPGISCVGRNERELTAAQVPYEVGQAFFRSLARAQITGEQVGMLKILFHRETLELLGVHCFGYQASEIIHIGQAIMRQTGAANSLRYFLDTTFNYPTMAEAYRMAALNGMQRIEEAGR